MTISGDSSPTPVAAHGLGKVVQGPGGALTILDRLELSVKAGEAVAVLGASGSGKSTLLGLLAGLDDASHGEVRLLGQSLAGLDEDARAALRAGRVGFVFQSFQLLPTLTAVENVLLPLELTDHADPQRAAGDALERVGLSARADHYPRQLSGGEQQRVAIARAFAPAPRVLFADEPTGNLDQTTGAHIVDLLLALRQSSGAALVLVTHDPHLAGHCDRRLLLDNGRLEPLA
jgi:putative ABC transport system ATP-binding protein